MPKLFKKVLVANRGEIAIRIIRALHELEIEAVAVYSDADRGSSHISLADEAYPLGDPVASESYLNIPKIIEIAKRARVDAIHPGYGFLSENDEFAFACEELGLTFIGPSPEVMRLMGDKVASRETMVKAGVPVVPGTTEAIRSLPQAKKISQKLGYPIVVKASAGGGGKGMRVVSQEKELEKSLAAAGREAKAAFGDETVYIEKYLEGPHHIEIQILGDTQGKVIHLFERECSIQRRHQKVIEESPSPYIDDKLRGKICKVALQAAKAIKYTNAGTFEFLVDKKKNFYFLEMNTRMQVEHPITEMVTGVDIVKLQIKIAEGYPIPFKQKEIVQKGHAIECRIYAEDPLNNFLPSPGKILSYRIPQGPFVRLDSYLYLGCEIPIYYDPLIGKLCVWGASRKEAVHRLSRVLKEFVIQGIRTNLIFHRQVVQMKHFTQGKYDTHFIDEEFKTPKTKPSQPLRNMVLAAAAVDAYKKTKASLAFVQEEFHMSPWLREGRVESLRHFNRGVF
ncbi:MAG: acetyl-CoA carboxylase biotin carboxylase subunit [Deltaproteobacteria bacterium]|nr:acetyl-CoA carboxylase biotin carboxylase subunit [Deltaproteobacteria bacterium]